MKVNVNRFGVKKVENNYCGFKDIYTYRNGWMETKPFLFHFGMWVCLSWYVFFFLCSLAISNHFIQSNMILLWPNVLTRDVSAQNNARVVVGMPHKCGFCEVNLACGHDICIQWSILFSFNGKWFEIVCVPYSIRFVWGGWCIDMSTSIQLKSSMRVLHYNSVGTLERFNKCQLEQESEKERAERAKKERKRER